MAEFRSLSFVKVISCRYVTVYPMIIKTGLEDYRSQSEACFTMSFCSKPNNCKILEQSKEYAIHLHLF